MKYLIAMGDVPPSAVEAVNLVIDARTQELAGRKAGEAPLAPAGRLVKFGDGPSPEADPRYLTRQEREARASTPGEPAMPVSDPPRAKRSAARWAIMQLEKQQLDAWRQTTPPDPQQVADFKQRHEEIEKQLAEAEQESKDPTREWVGG